MTTESSASHLKVIVPFHQLFVNSSYLLNDKIWQLQTVRQASIWREGTWESADFETCLWSLRAMHGCKIWLSYSIHHLTSLEWAFLPNPRNPLILCILFSINFIACCVVIIFFPSFLVILKVLAPYVSTCNTQWLNTFHLSSNGKLSVMIWECLP